MSSYIHFTEEQKQRAAAAVKSCFPLAEKNALPVTTA